VARNALVIGPASMYTTIKKLFGANLIEFFDDNDPKRNLYDATEEGIQLLKKEVKRRQEMVFYAV
jgi:DNA-binding PadR family transcriptional regulator